jgi:predicted RNA-binding Zn-ribbon protein involved in translation (DUF1610 family)
MVFFFPVILNDLFESGRKYQWPKPGSCARCSSIRLWGHGYVTACFDGFNAPLFLKRYRCPDCGCIIRLRPEGYLKRFQASIATIRSSIESKVQTGKWIDVISRSRQQHWFKSLVKRIKAYLADGWQQGVLAGFDYFLKSGQTPVGRSI